MLWLSLLCLLGLLLNLISWLGLLLCPYRASLLFFDWYLYNRLGRCLLLLNIQRDLVSGILLLNKAVLLIW